MLDNKTIKTIKEIMFRHIDPKSVKVFIFGSRATGDALKYSDIDIGIEAKKSLSLSKIARIKEEFEESDLPYLVDIVDFKSATSRFKEVVAKNKIYLN